jgi:hypothetical protein
MTQPHQQLKALEQIRSLMEQSSRFISLSGLSGIAAGVFALLGAAGVYLYLGMVPFSQKYLYYNQARVEEKWGLSLTEFLLIDGLVVLLLGISSGIFFTTRKAKRNNQAIWDPLTQRLLINLFIPLVAGGIFCLALLYHGFIGFIAPATLIFYGLALLNASKYTLNDIRYLGLCQVGLGLIGMFFLGHGLELWAFGFGVLHILYGWLMYHKYERKTV